MGWGYILKTKRDKNIIEYMHKSDMQAPAAPFPFKSDPKVQNRLKVLEMFRIKKKEVYIF